jgi:RND family efflux transporter MFP subunit
MVTSVSASKKQFYSAVALLFGAIVLTTLLFLNRPETEIAPPVQVAVSVDVAEVVKQSLRIPVQAQGTVSPMRETSIMSEVNGRIIEVSPAFTVGGFVSQGDVLLRIDPRDYETNLLRAEAAVKSAESILAQEKGGALVAEREWQKLPAGSQRSEEAKNLYLRKPQLAQAQAQLLAARADLNTAKDNLERTFIRAPYDALIRTKRSDLGQFVAAGTPLADVFAVEYAEIRLPIPQNKLEYLELPGLNGEGTGSTIDLTTDVGGTVKHWTARLQRTEGVYDERSRVLYAVARIEDPYGLRHPDREPLLIGTFVNATIDGRELHDVVPLPRYVLRAGNNLWVIDKNNRLRNREVTLLRTGGDIVYVSAGLDNGERVALTVLDSSLDGSEVIIQSTIRSDQLNRGSPQVPPEGEVGSTAATESDTGNGSGG